MQTELDRQLQQMAVLDWDTFVKVIGEDAIIKAKVCILKSRSLSYPQVSIKLKITPRQAQHATGKCPCDENGRLIQLK